VLIILENEIDWRIITNNIINKASIWKKLGYKLEHDGEFLTLK
jgi:hypothetical protein